MRNPFDDSADGCRPLSTKRHFYVVGDLASAETCFEAEEVTLFDPETGVQVMTRSAIYPLECGHVIGSIGAAELVAACGVRNCAALLCFRCSGSRCVGEGCGIILCPEHKRVFEGECYCPRCNRLERLKHRLRSGASAVHRLLSAE